MEERRFNSAESAVRFCLAEKLAGDEAPALRAAVRADRPERVPDLVLSTERRQAGTGTTLVRIEQTRPEIPVFGAEVLVDLDDNQRLMSMDGRLGEAAGAGSAAMASGRRRARRSRPPDTSSTGMDPVAGGSRHRRKAVAVMARVTVEGSEVVVRLGLREGLAARRRQVRVPVSALREVHVERSWWRVLRGRAGSGTWSPGRCSGIRRRPDGEDFVAVKAESTVLCLELAEGAPFRRVAVSVPDAARAERAVREVMPQDPGPEHGTGPGPEPGPRDASPRPALQHEGGTADDHGRQPGVPSRTGSDAGRPPLDAERVERANADRVRRDHVVPGTPGARS
ncbi:hypothetical protein [Streptomyces amritsarensis]